MTEPAPTAEVMAEMAARGNEIITALLPRVIDGDQTAVDLAARLCREQVDAGWGPLLMLHLATTTAVAIVALAQVQGEDPAAVWQRVCTQDARNRAGIDPGAAG
jgi:uncharacterized protein (DUF2237 family)